jgi:quercetin dioxygenase-like cupin family protein
MRRSVGFGPILCLALAAVLWVSGAGSRAESTATLATPVAGGLPGVASEVLGRGESASAPGQELAVARVTIAAGAAIPEHEHPGTQVAAIIAGELTYTVVTGEVPVTRAGGEIETVGAGQTVTLRPGDSLVEQPGVRHHAENNGPATVEIALATLFPPDEPRTIFVTPAP